jgi:tryptophan 2,3-dioxygenase
MLFIVIHQTKELWLKQMLTSWSLPFGWSARTGSRPPTRRLRGSSRIQSVMTLSWDVLSTLTPVDYLRSAKCSAPRRVFQSAQFRELEFRIGIKDERYLKHYPATARNMPGCPSA